jgi:hypothetical protein
MHHFPPFFLVHPSTYPAGSPQVFGAVAYYFSTKMSRLIILLGPICSALGGIAIGFVVDWCLANIFQVMMGDGLGVFHGLWWVEIGQLSQP